MHTRELIVVGASGVVGGIIGYLIADFVWYKFFNPEYVFETFDPDMNKWVKEDESTKEEESKGRVDYSKYSKADLSTLVKSFKEPFVVDADALYNLVEEESEYEQQTIMYYVEDSVFADVSGTIFDKDPQVSFGANIQLHFGEKSGDPDVVYVANLNDKIVYEIVQVHSSYRKDVLGEVEPVKKRKARGSVVKKEFDEDRDDTNE